MKASELNVSSITSASDCYTMIDRIWMDSRNCQGGIAAFMSGKQTYLTAAAKRKVEALERRAMTLNTVEEWKKEYYINEVRVMEERFYRTKEKLQNSNLDWGISRNYIYVYG